MTTFTELVLRKIAAALAAKFQLDEVEVLRMVLVREKPLRPSFRSIVRRRSCYRRSGSPH
jgi:hypothetical protein